MTTIFALSSGAPPAAIALMRLSGPQAFHAVASLTGGSLPLPRVASVRALRDPDNGLLLDRAIVLLFPGPDSATGEDIAELHLHGGRAIVRAVERVLRGMPLLREAEAGEFTLRALVSGRLDLTQAEALGDLLSAETEYQRRAALQGADGGLRHLVERWADRTLGLSAVVEAVIDHDDEDDVTTAGVSIVHVGQQAADLAQEIQAVVAQPPVERLHHGLTVVLAGPPNSGKSSLINVLADRDVTIVSPVSGTTRDKVEAAIARKGIAWRLIDTAGLTEDSDDPIERMGVALARDAIIAADVVLWLGDDQAPQHDCVISLHARADLPDRTDVPSNRLAVSAATRHGIDDLWSLLDEKAEQLLPPVDGVAMNARQRLLGAQAATALEMACIPEDPLLIAEHLRSARIAFDRLTGRSGTEEMLDALFGRFCIGK